MAMTTVQGKEGWCVCRTKSRSTLYADQIPTLCGHYIIFPFNISKSVKPTCSECLKILKREK
jgi:hypothetical protein